MQTPGILDGELAEISTIQALMPDVRDYIRRHVPPDWPQLAGVIRPLVDEPLGPLGILPLASCAAVGGDPSSAIPVAAAWEVLSLAIRILDDLQDGNDPEGLWASLGAPRAFNFSAALYALSSKMLVEAPWSAEQYRAISAYFYDGAIQTAAGQDRDLRGASTSLDDYWRTIEAKNGTMFAFACAAGARCGTGDLELVDSCRAFGRHLGLALQLFDDLEGVWEPIGVGDLEANKVTLPVIYGLSTEHDRREELRGYVESGRMPQFAGTIREILDGIRTRQFIVWAALKEREEALKSLDACPAGAGVVTLRAYITALFAEIESVVGGEPTE